jgi:hypothetical protein
MGIFAITLIVGAASLAMAGVPDVTQCQATTAFDGAVVMNSPDGNGRPFTDARALGEAGPVDATITLIIRDSAGVPIANYPAEDSWLESMDGLMSICAGGSVADNDSDVDGMTEFQDALRTGGWSLAGTRVLINGNALINSVNVNFNSPDVNGDLVVNLTDVQLFAGDFFGVGYGFRSDLFVDNVVYLSDLPRLATARAAGAACP